MIEFTDFNKLVLSCGIRVVRGAIVHLETDNCYMEAPSIDGKPRQRISLVMKGKSFYARARVVEPWGDQEPKSWRFG